MAYPTVILKRNRVASIRRRHPWIFSGGVQSAEGCKSGDIVSVQSANDEFLGIGYFQDGSIMVRMLSFENEEINESFWFKKFSIARDLRASLYLPSKSTNAYRLIHGEGDGIPGLIIDIYNDIAVIQCHTIGMYLLREVLSRVLVQVFDKVIDTIYVKSGNTLPKSHLKLEKDHFIIGQRENTIIHENGHSFKVDIVSGQKTGFFLDQRTNRQLLTNFCEGKRVLNLFSYTGGFSTYAIANNAAHVVSVDASKRAIELCEQNIALTDRETHHEGVVADVHQYLNTIDKDEFDVIVVDPPAYAKSVRKKHNAVQAYKRINSAVIRKIRSGGIIFTFSCSQVVDQELFVNTITAAAIDAGRKCQILHQLMQGPDHPINIFHPEGHYLKGLILKIT